MIGRFIPATIALVLALLAGCDRFTSVDTRLARAASGLEAGEFPAALIDLRKALEAEPDNLEARLLLVDVLAASGEIPAARVQLDQAKQAGAAASLTEARTLRLLRASNDSEAMKQALEQSATLSAVQRNIFAGQMLLLEGKPAEALSAFELALLADAESTEAALGRIESLAGKGEHRAARQAVDELLERRPESGQAWLFKGSLAAHAGDFDTATEAYGKAIENSRGMSREQRLQAEIERIETLLASGEVEQARSMLAAFMVRASGSPMVSLLNARIALADKDAARAVNELRRFTQRASQHLPGRLLLITALQEQGSLEQAFAEAARCVAEFPDQDEPRLALAGVQLSMSRTSDAEETLKPLVTQSPPNQSAASMLAEIRMRMGDAAASVALLEQSIVEHPTNARLKLQLATTYLSAGDAQRALQVLNAVQEPELAGARDRLRVMATAAVQDPAAVERELQAALLQNPGDVELLFTAAGYAASTGQIDLARERLRKAHEARPNDLVLTLQLARLELSAAQFTEAEQLAKSVLDKVSGDINALVLMAAIAERRGQPDEAEAWLNRARLTDPGAVDVGLALARRAALRGSGTEARSILSELVGNSPHHVGARVALAELIASQGEHAEALRELREAARQHPQAPVVPFSMARVQIATKDIAAARRSAQQAFKLDPGWLPAATLLASLEVESGRLQAALEVVAELRRAKPGGTSADLLEAETYLLAGRPALAARAFAIAYQRKPLAEVAVRTLQAKLRARTDKPDAELQDWISRKPEDATARRAMGEYLMTVGRDAEAIAQLEQVVAARPTDGVALNNLAWLYARNGDERALPTAEKAYAVAPREAAIADTYGWILVQAGRTAEGLKLLEEAAATAPADAGVLYHLAYALAEAGQTQRAMQLLRDRLRGAPDSAAVRTARRLLSSLERAPPGPVPNPE